MIHTMFFVYHSHPEISVFQQQSRPSMRGAWDVSDRAAQKSTSHFFSKEKKKNRTDIVILGWFRWWLCMTLSMLLYTTLTHMPMIVVETNTQSFFVVYAGRRGAIMFCTHEDMNATRGLCAPSVLFTDGGMWNGDKILFIVHMMQRLWSHVKKKKGEYNTVFIFACCTCMSLYSHRLRVPHRADAHQFAVNLAIRKFHMCSLALAQFDQRNILKEMYILLLRDGYFRTYTSHGCVVAVAGAGAIW